MKTILTAALVFTFTTASAFAASKPGISCKEMGTGIDNGYSATILPNLTKAEIGETTIAGYKKLAVLKCEKSTEQLPGNDRINVIANCAEPFKNDAGYVLTVSSGGIAGLTTAVLGEVNRDGTNVLAQMNCNTSRVSF